MSLEEILKTIIKEFLLGALLVSGMYLLYTKFSSPDMLSDNPKYMARMAWFILNWEILAITVGLANALFSLGRAAYKFGRDEESE